MYEVTRNCDTPSVGTILLLYIEWIVLFLLPPILIWAHVVTTHKVFIFALPILYAYIIYVTRYSSHERKRLSPSLSSPLRRECLYIFLRIAVATVVLSLIVLIIHPYRFLSFPRERPDIWVMVILLYSLLSAWPQEFLYRRFYMVRYAPLFRSSRLMMLSSTVTFAFLHIIYMNIFSVLLTLIGGWLFTRTYMRTGHLGLTTLEHALYGIIMFSCGLGYLFYTPITQ